MTRLSPLLPLLAFIAAALAVGLVFRYPLVTDDPYITYRYARNLLDGAGLVYNAGERVLSTTTPLYALTLAALGLFYRDIPALGYWLSVVSLGVGAYFLFALAASVKARGGGIVAGALLLAAPALVMTFGLETNFYLMLGLAALYAYLRARVTLAFALAALLTLARSDGVILAGILSLTYLWQNRGLLSNPPSAIRHPHFLRPFLIYLLILAPWLVIAWLYFGSPFPFTLTAKIAQAQSGLWDSFAVGLIKWARDDALWLAPLSAFALVGVIWALRARSLTLLLGAWASLHLVAYAILGVAFYPWYVAPLIPASCLFAGIGVERAGEWVQSFSKLEFLKYGFITLCGIALVVPELRADVRAGMTRPSPKVAAYVRAADWLKRNAAPDATVDALEVGVIGYYDARRTVDFVGLVDPPRIPYLRAQKFADGVRRAAAEYVIAIPPDTWLPNDVWFKDAYRAVERIRMDGLYGNQPLVIYQRADAGRAPRETIPVRAAFERRIELERVDLFTREIARGDILPVRLHLRALNFEPVPETWKFTLQLVGAENRVAAQTDNFCPARLPEDGKPFQDVQGIPIPQDAPPGEYALILAMYDVRQNERLSLYDANGNEVGDFLEFGHVKILP